MANESQTVKMLRAKIEALQNREPAMQVPEDQIGGGQPVERRAYEGMNIDTTPPPAITAQRGQELSDDANFGAAKIRDKKTRIGDLDQQIADRLRMMENERGPRKASADERMEGREAMGKSNVEDRFQQGQRARGR